MSDRLSICNSCNQLCSRTAQGTGYCSVNRTTGHYLRDDLFYPAKQGAPAVLSSDTCQTGWGICLRCRGACFFSSSSPTEVGGCYDGNKHAFSTALSCIFSRTNIYQDTGFHWCVTCNTMVYDDTSNVSPLTGCIGTTTGYHTVYKGSQYIIMPALADLSPPSGDFIVPVTPTLPKVVVKTTSILTTWWFWLIVVAVVVIIIAVLMVII